MPFGVRLCAARGLQELQVETDSLSLAKIMQGRQHSPWRLQQEVDDLLRYQQHIREITHCYREANKPTDYLANWGQMRGMIEFLIAKVNCRPLSVGRLTWIVWVTLIFVRDLYD